MSTPAINVNNNSQPIQHELTKHSLDVISIVISKMDDSTKSGIACTDKFFSKKVVDVAKTSTKGILSFFIRNLSKYPALVEDLREISSDPFFSTLGMKDLITELPQFRRTLINLLKKVELSDLEELKKPFEELDKPENMESLIDLVQLYREFDQAILEDNMNAAYAISSKVSKIDPEKAEDLSRSVPFLINFL